MIRMLRMSLTFPLRLVGKGNDSSSYTQLPRSPSSSSSSSQFSSVSTINETRKVNLQQPWPRLGRFSITRLAALLAFAIVLILVITGGGYHYKDEVISVSQLPSWDELLRWRNHIYGNYHPRPQDLPWNDDLRGQLVDDGREVPFDWKRFPRLDGYYNGLRTLVKSYNHRPEQSLNNSIPLVPLDVSNVIPFEPITFDPYPQASIILGSSLFNHRKPVTCFLDEKQKLHAPDILVYPGIPQHMTDPFFGSYDELGLDSSVCYDRFGRLGPYGYGYDEHGGGLSIGMDIERQDIDIVLDRTGRIDWRSIDWFSTQTACVRKNQHRFENDTSSSVRTSSRMTPRVLRNVFIIRSYTGFEWDGFMTATVRALVTELNVKTGGEYDVHILIQVRDNSLPVWADKKLYRRTLQEAVPREFWGISSLWSEQQMATIYPNPFPNNLRNPSETPLHSRYRSGHFALQWYSQQHPEYDFVWNWELDSRYTGHYYEFFHKIAQWARKQPRKGLWERSARYYIPKIHGNWSQYVQHVENEIASSGEAPIWGPVEFSTKVRDFLAIEEEANIPPSSYDTDDYEWGVGEEADLITFNPIFDAEKTTWVFRDDVTGFDINQPPPPRRAAIITMARLSKRLLNIMHEETWLLKHTMVQEMWPSACALHHGLKAVYVPHPVYFDRNWPLDHMEQVFNHPKGPEESPFGWAEHLHLGSSFYYNSQFSPALWRRWLGHRENHEGGLRDEKKGTGRMCLRAQLFHPVKQETEYGRPAK